MKVMTNKTEARGLQSRTEIRQTVAQMAAPNFKDSAPEDSPGHTRTILRPGSSLARRVAMLLILIIGMVGSAWGAETIEKYLVKGTNSVTPIVTDLISHLSTTKDDMKDHYYIKWYVLYNDVKQDLNTGSASGAAYGFKGQNGFWPYVYDTSKKQVFIYNGTKHWDNSNAFLQWGVANLLYLDTPTFYSPSTFDENCVLVCEGTDVAPTVDGSSVTTEPESKIIYKFYFNATGKEPDTFIGTFAGTPSELEKEVASASETSATVDFSSYAGAKYARFYVVSKSDPSTALDISRDAITVTGQINCPKTKHGVYLYNSTGLTAEDLDDVTLTIAGGNLKDYLLIGVFANDITGMDPSSGENITKEPTTLSNQVNCNFVYPVKTIDKYVKWDQHSYSFKVTDDITTSEKGLGKTQSELVANGYLKWYLLDSGGNKVTMENNYLASYTGWSVNVRNTAEGSQWPCTWGTGNYYFYSSPFNNDYFSKITAPYIFAPNSDTFSLYPDYTVVCDASDENLSGGVEPEIKIRYVFHFTPTGKPVDTFLSDRKGSISGSNPSKEIILNTDNGYDKSTNSIELPAAKRPDNWPSVDAKYIRWYVTDSKGDIVTDATTATNPWIALPSGFYRDADHGYIWYSTDGTTTKATGSLDIPKMTLPSGKNLEDYILVARISTTLDNATDGSTVADNKVTKEPAWDTEFTFTYAEPFKGEVTGTKVEKTFKLAASQWNAAPKKFCIDFDFANSKILLKDKDNLETLASVSMDESFWATNYPGASVSGKNFYIRWFLKNKATGVETYIPKGICNIDAETFRPCDKEKYGLFWSKKLDDGQVDLDEILRIMIDGSPVSPGTEFAITDYDLVCTIGTDGTEKLDNDTHLVTQEPATLQMQYTFHFEDKPFEAENLATVKTVYKTALYDKTTGKISPSLFANYQEILTELSSTLDNVRANGYVRWYVTDAEGNLVSDMADWGFSATEAYTKNNTYGHYILPNLYEYNKTQFDPTITLPSSYDKGTDYKNYKVVCVVTTDRTGMSLPDCEPTNMQVKYVFNLIASDELDALPFVHYKGESGRDYITPDGSSGSQAQKVWNTSTGQAEDFTGDIRQGVHTWEYEVYIKPGETRKLLLPIQDFVNTSHDDALEPRGYFRWYDWKTDKAVVDGNFTFAAPTGTLLKSIDGRGLFALALDTGVHPDFENIGVTFTPTADFTESFDIACDVSKYSDGIVAVGSSSYLLHEPTLSNRYIFHIHPASESANLLESSKNTLISAEDIIKAKGTDAEMHDEFVNEEYNMFNLAENKGKVVVSLGAGKTGSFALRLDEHNLLNYILNTGTSETPNYVSANKVQWYAYFENDAGIWKKKIGDADDRIKTFNFSDFTTGAEKYYNLKGEEGPNITDGKKFHVVGYVGNGTFDVKAGTGNYAPVVHYELHFIEAPAIPVSNLSANLERTDEYLDYHYDLAGVVDFDGNPETNPNVSGKEAEYYSTTNWYDKPTSPAENLTYVPFEWDDVQYGFCYPQLVPTVKNGMGPGISPEHGDYIILKSMNIAGISEGNLTYPIPYNYYWWSNKELYDYTHTVTDKSKYGSFLYTDASDESRTIATIPFTADLCHGSSIYFTAAVADMTTADTKPELLIRIVGIDEGGNRHRVVAFHTGDIKTTGGSSGVWNQTYGMSTIPVDFNDEITHFVAEVINYAKDTRGADFAIDELKIYTSTSKVMLSQSGNTTCEDPTNGKLKIYMDAEGLQNVYGKSDTEKTIYWRICREDDGTVVTAPGMYPQYDGAGNKLADDGTFTYGVSKVKSNFNPATDVEAEADREADAYGWYKAADNTIYFQIASQNFPGLEEGGRYYVSIYDPNRDPFVNSQESYWGGLHWGATSKCSVFSNFFIPQRQYVTYQDGEGGKEGGDISVACGGAATVSGIQMILKVPDVKEATGFKTVKTLHYDYVYVPLATWTSTTETFTSGGNTYAYADLKTALADYRGASSAYKTEVGLNSGYLTHYAILNAAVTEGILELAYSTTFSHTFGSSSTVTCIPVEQSVEISTGVTTVCSPFEVTFKLLGSSPELALGFSDVKYPVSGYEKRVVRIGLEQLNNLRNNGYKLHIPVNTYKDKDKKSAYPLYFKDVNLTLSAASSDGVNTAVGTQFAKIVNPDDNSEAPLVDANHMYLELDFSGDNCNVTFYEGFEYEVSTSYYDSRDYGVTGRCEGDIYLVFKVVPEFVTWEPQQISGDYYNVNWNNDANWHRSTRAELYKDENVDGKKQNTATSGHPDGYDDNGEHSLNSITSTTKNSYNTDAFIPMRFSYVTLPKDCRAPSLVNMGIRAYPHTKEAHLGGVIQAGDMGTDRSPNDGGTSVATTNLRYDMLVRYPLVAGDDQDQCQGHLMADGTTVVGDGKVKTYDCEKFIGNACREIYFKPGAEIINQQRLVDYQKAWVEKALDRNKWYLLSAPLKGTYAGDMYLPATAITDYSLATPATVTGKQVTEAFQPINFNETTYSRTDYPVYQRSWDHSEHGGKVYTETTDPRKTDYTANLKYSGAVTSTFAQWTHTYNDMAVKYNELQGFVARAHRKDGETGETALFRWPKADQSYTYYDYNDAAGSVTATTIKAAGEYGRFVTDGLDNKASMTVALTTATALDQPNVNTDNQYYLVGNPYMASIDMAKFLAMNTGLGTAFWKVDGAPATGSATGQIKPMESFFVKVTDPTVPVEFDNSLMIDGNAPLVSSVSPARPRLVMRASNGEVSSTATIELSEKASAEYVGAEDVETLFDSNLSDVPMVFTVAGKQAVSIDQRPEIDVVSFGVSCAESNDLVEVTVDDSELALSDGQLYVVDAVTGDVTAVGEGSSVMVQPNDYGRYFLTTRGDLTAVTGVETNGGIVVSVRGSLVTVKAGEALTSVRALTTGGATVYSEADCGPEMSFKLNQGGVYIIEAQTAEARKTVKIVVKN